MVAKIEDMKSIPSRIEVLSKIEVYSTLTYTGNIYIYIHISCSSFQPLILMVHNHVPNEMALVFPPKNRLVESYVGKCSFVRLCVSLCRFLFFNV